MINDTSYTKYFFSLIWSNVVMHRQYSDPNIQ